VRIARIVSLLALGVGIVLGLGILFGPFYYGCTVTVSPGQTPAPQICRGSSLIEIQGAEHLFPAPLLWIAAWSLAPLLAVTGVWTGRWRSQLIALAILIELTGIISLGGGFIFTLLIEPLLLVTLIASRRAAPLATPNVAMG
jgi:hypothetical protein